MNILSPILDALAGPGFLTMTMFAVLVVGRLAFHGVSRWRGYSLTQETVVRDNVAVCVRWAMFTLAIVLSFRGILHPSGIGFKEDLNIMGKYALMVIGLLFVAQWINDKIILRAFNNDKEVVGEKNLAVAMVEGATSLATAFILSGSLGGWEGGYQVSLIWFAIGQVTLILLALLYRLFRQGVVLALDNQNIACALSFGGFLLSGGLMLGSALSGPFAGWTSDLRAVGLYALLWLVLMGVCNWLADLFMLPSAKFKQEIMADKNAGVGLIEAVGFVAITLMYTWLW